TRPIGSTTTSSVTSDEMRNSIGMDGTQGTILRQSCSTEMAPKRNPATRCNLLNYREILVCIEPHFDWQSRSESVRKPQQKIPRRTSSWPTPTLRKRGMHRLRTCAPFRLQRK